MGRLIQGALVVVTLVVASVSLAASPAAADAKVSVRNSKGSAAIDTKYLTELTLSGSDFQSIKNGHGGIYVLFGAVKGTWQPSKGGKTGTNYFTVPDSESEDNSGYARFVAFPGSDTAGSAQTTMSSDGDWSTTLKVPAATFKSLDRNGKATTVDCEKMTCGVLTIGAHGVTNANNETFTKVDVTDLYTDNSSTSSSTATPTATPSAGAEALTPADDLPAEVVSAPTAGGPMKLTVDRASARPGRIVAFSATGLKPGASVSATFDDGRAGAGPLTVNAAGEVAGLLQMPNDVAPGTYELRLVGEGRMPSARFAVISNEKPATGSVRSVRSAVTGVVGPWAPYAFAALGFLALVGAVAFGIIQRRNWKVGTHAI